MGATSMVGQRRTFVALLAGLLVAGLLMVDGVAPPALRIGSAADSAGGAGATASSAEVASDGAVLALEASGIDASGTTFTNRVLVNGEQLAVLPATSDLATVHIGVPDRLLSSGETEVVIESAPSSPRGRVDTFALRDVRLLLADGRELRDRDHVPGRTYRITGDRWAWQEPVKYNPLRRYVFTVPQPGGTISDAVAPRVLGSAGGSGNAKPLRDGEGVGGPLAAADVDALARADGVFAETRVDAGFAYQEFSLQAPDAGSHVQVDWSGRTVAGDGASLYAFSHPLGRWVEVATADAGAPDLRASATLARATFVRDGAVRVLVMQRQVVGHGDFTVAWYTDPQVQTVVALQPADLPGQVADWVLANRAGIGYLTTTGDMVEHPEAAEEWRYVSDAMHPLDDAAMPYGVLPGNHDYFNHGIDPYESVDGEGTDAALVSYAEHFGAARYRGRPWYRAQFRNNEGHYDLMELGGQQLAFLYLGSRLSREAFDWAAEQLRGPLADIPVVLAVHQYLRFEDEDVAESLDTPGRYILAEVVRPHANVIAVLTGHESSTGYIVRREDGRVVPEVLHDYQGETEGGAAYLRLLDFDLDGQQLRSREYSPHHDDFLMEGYDVRRQEFTVPLQLRPASRRVATDALVVGTARTGSPTLTHACPDDRVPPSGYHDVSSTSVHAAAIDCVTWWDIATGRSADEYAPAEQVTRAQMAAFLDRLLTATSGTQPYGPDAFADDDGGVHEAAINRLAAAGVVRGTGPGQFDPGGVVTREQMATFLLQAYDRAGGTPVADDVDAFGDDDGSVHEANINRAATLGVATGVAPGRYAPRQPVTRAAMASFLARVLDALVADGLASPPA